MTVHVPLAKVHDSPFQTRTSFDEAVVERIVESILSGGNVPTAPARLVGADGAPLTDCTRTAYVLRPWTKPGLPSDPEAQSAYVAETLAENGWAVQLASGHTRRESWRRAWARRDEVAGDLVAGRGFPGLDGRPDRTVPLDVVVMTDDEMEDEAWRENHDRKDLDPVDRAAAIAARMARHGWDQTQAAEALGMDRTTIGNIRRWHAALTSGGEPGAAALAYMRTGEIRENQARALAGVFQLVAEQPAVYAALTGPSAGVARLDDLASLVRWASMREVKESHVRNTLNRWREAFAAEAERQRREREPEMFGAPATPPPTAEPDANLHEPPFGTDEDGEPLGDPGTIYVQAMHGSLHSAGVRTSVWVEVEVSARFEAMDEEWAVAQGLRHHVPLDSHLNVYHVRTGASLNVVAYTVDEATAQAREIIGAQTKETLLAALDAYPFPKEPRPEVSGDADYDDGGRQLAAVAGSVGADLGVQPLPDGDDPATEEREHPGHGEPPVEVEGDTLVERDTASEPWDEFGLAVDEVLAGVSPESRRVLLPALWPEGFRNGKTTTRWRDSGAWRDHAVEMIRDALIDDHTPQSAAEALGLEVEWPDVSTDTTEPDGSGEAWPHRFPMVPRLEAAGLISLGDLRADIRAKGGPAAWVHFAVERYDGLGSTRASRVADAAFAPGGYPFGDVPADAHDVHCANCGAELGEACRKPGGGHHPTFSHADRRHALELAQQEHAAQAADVSTDTPPAADPGPFSGDRPSQADDPVAATRAALDAGDDPDLIRRDLSAAMAAELAKAKAAQAVSIDEVDDYLLAVERHRLLSEAVELLPPPAEPWFDFSKPPEPGEADNPAGVDAELPTTCTGRPETGQNAAPAVDTPPAPIAKVPTVVAPADDVQANELAALFRGDASAVDRATAATLRAFVENRERQRVDPDVHELVEARLEELAEPVAGVTAGRLLEGTIRTLTGVQSDAPAFRASEVHGRTFEARGHEWVVVGALDHTGAPQPGRFDVAHVAAGAVVPVSAETPTDARSALVRMLPAYTPESLAEQMDRAAAVRAELEAAEEAPGVAAA